MLKTHQGLIEYTAIPIGSKIYVKTYVKDSLATPNFLGLSMVLSYFPDGEIHYLGDIYIYIYIYCM